MLRLLRKALAAPLALVAVGAASSSADDGPAVVAEQQVGELVVVNGSFEVDAGAAEVWAVLSDYEHLSRFVSSIDRSAVVRRDAGALLIDQVATGRVLLLSHQVRVRLEVTEEPLRQIAFHDVGRSDFSYYAGSWTLQPAAQGMTRVRYRLRARPRLALPAAVAGPAFRATAVQLLEQVRAEITRRTTRIGKDRVER